jgi:hypothetical protein
MVLIGLVCSKMKNFQRNAKFSGRTFIAAETIPALSFIKDSVSSRLVNSLRLLKHFFFIQRHAPGLLFLKHFELILVVR